MWSRGALLTMLGSALVSGCVDLDVVMAKARANASSRDYKSAAAECDEVLAEAPTHLEARRIRFRVRLGLNDMTGAAADARVLAASDPDHVNAFRNLGDVLMERRDYDGAVAAYLELARLIPSEAMPYNSAGNALLRRGDIDGAIGMYRQAVQRTRNPVDDYDADERRRTNRVVWCNPNVAFPHTNLGWALIAKGDDAGALDAFKEATRPTGPAEAYAGMAAVLERRGDLQGALRLHAEAEKREKIAQCGWDYPPKPVHTCEDGYANWGRSTEAAAKTLYCMRHSYAGPAATPLDLVAAKARIFHSLGDHASARDEWVGVIAWLKSQPLRGQDGGSEQHSISLEHARAAADAEDAHAAEKEEQARNQQTRQEAIERAEQEATARNEDRERKLREEAERKREWNADLMARRHSAARLDVRQAAALVANPFPYRGKNVMLDLVYARNIGPTKAILFLYPTQAPVQMDTATNFAGGGGLVRCVATVLGLVTVRQGSDSIDIPHLRKVACVDN